MIKPIQITMPVEINTEVLSTEPAAATKTRTGISRDGKPDNKPVAFGSNQTTDP